MSGKVWLVGAGPGDSGLFTLKGLEVLQGADVVVYDALIGVELMALIPEDAVKIDVGKRASNHRMPQEGINKVLLVAFKKNEGGNAFWESQGITLREDLNYRNKALVEMVRIDPDYLAEEAEIETV